jgi:hypothetical protein
MKRILVLAACLAAGPLAAVGAVTAEEAGLRMYRDGVLPSGEPMTALVAGDVPVVGTQFSCERCHGRSGMGASEGAYVVPPVAAPFLLHESPQPKRPAYDAESLGRLLRDGVTPSGRQLSVELMPRYQVDDGDVSALMAYLSTLSDGNSAGVDQEIIRFATVVVDGVDPGKSKAMFDVLNRFALDINQESRLDSERWDRGYTPESKLPTVFREWVFDEWRLTGSPDSWAAQLQRYYRAAPVFAMVGGLGPGSWKPISDFCEREKIPCLFPGTDLPAAAGEDFYTYYFSRGIALEADLIAEHLVSEPVGRVVQVHCRSVLDAATRGQFGDALQRGGATVGSLEVDCEQGLNVDARPLLEAGDDTALVLWLSGEQLRALAPALPAARLYLSSTILGAAADPSLQDLPGELFMAHPYRLPGRVDPGMRRFEIWAKTRDVDITHSRIQSEAFFACLALRHAVKHVGRFFVREFVLDVLDHSQNLSAYVPYYERPTFGPGQRFLSKGGYVLPVEQGRPVTADAEWLLP